MKRSEKLRGVSFISVELRCVFRPADSILCSIPCDAHINRALKVTESLFSKIRSCEIQPLANQVLIG